ncbi:WYL domain-containing protein [Lysinibacillus pakistanensis]|uniref:WYL domain-containing protein n=1 Tax=Lysinibacillus pakistanensis TaxID=759811 RepID=UPI003D2BB6E5
MLKSELMSIETSLKSRLQVLDDNSTFNAILKLNKIGETPDFEIDLSLTKGNTELRKLVLDLLSAIRNNELISFNYINSKGEESIKTTEPYRVVYKDRSWYLDAYCYSKEKFKIYKLASISNPSIIGTFSKREYQPLAYNGGGWRKIKFQLLF